MLERFHQAVPAFYLACALPFVLILAWLSPPWSNPDEPAHMRRAVEIAHGELLGFRRGLHDAGGLSDPAITDANTPVDDLKFHPERKVTLPMLSASEQARWSPVLSAQSFPNTAQYPPTLYIPAALAVGIGQFTRLSVDRTLYLARAIGAVIAVLLSFIGIVLSRRTRYVLATLAILPMTCTLDASVSQDGLMIALTILAVGWIDRIIERGFSAGGWEFLGLAVAIGCVAMARPPYLPLVLLLPLASFRLRWPVILSVLAVIAATGAWSALVADKIMITFPRADPTEQLKFLWAHPAHFGILVLHNLQDLGGAYAIQFIGRLGWLDTALPFWYILFGCAVLACGFLAAMSGASHRAWLAFLAVAAAAFIVFAIQYVTWTPAEADHIDGIQGRYFIPLAAAFALAIPGIRPLGSIFRPLAIAGLCVFGAITPFVTVQALVVRYYLGG